MCYKTNLNWLKILMVKLLNIIPKTVNCLKKWKNKYTIKQSYTGNKVNIITTLPKITKHNYTG